MISGLLLIKIKEGYNTVTTNVKTTFCDRTPPGLLKGGARKFCSVISGFKNSKIIILILTKWLLSCLLMISRLFCQSSTCFLAPQHGICTQINLVNINGVGVSKLINNLAVSSGTGPDNIN